MIRINAIAPWAERIVSEMKGYDLIVGPMIFQSSDGCAARVVSFGICFKHIDGSVIRANVWDAMNEYGRQRVITELQEAGASVHRCDSEAEIYDLARDLWTQP